MCAFVKQGNLHGTQAPPVFPCAPHWPLSVTPIQLIGPFSLPSTLVSFLDIQVRVNFCLYFWQHNMVVYKTFNVECLSKLSFLKSCKTCNTPTHPTLLVRITQLFKSWACIESYSTGRERRGDLYLGGFLI